jgi:hypothetical protein
MRIGFALLVAGLQGFALAAPASAAERQVEIVDGANGNEFILTFDDAPIGPNGQLDLDVSWRFRRNAQSGPTDAYSLPERVNRLRDNNGEVEIRDRRDLRFDGEEIRGRLRGFVDCDDGTAQLTLRVRRGPGRGTYQVIKQPGDGGTFACTAV